MCQLEGLLAGDAFRNNTKQMLLEACLACSTTLCVFARIRHSKSLIQTCPSCFLFGSASTTNISKFVLWIMESRGKWLTAHHSNKLQNNGHAPLSLGLVVYSLPQLIEPKPKTRTHTVLWAGMFIWLRPCGLASAQQDHMLSMQLDLGLRV